MNPESHSGTAKAILETASVFWPAVICPAVAALSINHHPWIAFLVSLAALALKRFWWTCVFGLLNLTIVATTLILSSFAWWRMI